MDENEVTNMHTLCACGQNFENFKIQQLLQPILSKLGGG